MAIAVFLSRSPGLLNPGPWGPVSLVLVFSTASYLNSSDPQRLNRESRGPLQLGVVLSAASLSNSLISKLIEFPVH